MSILVSGSLAYDVIMNFPDRFTDHILPDKLHALSVSFTVDNLHQNFGGTAGNIAYSLSVLEANPILFAPLGSDGERYRTYLQEHNIADTYVPTENIPTATAHVITDKDNNQITAFYPGALVHADKYSFNDVKEECALAIIAPNPHNAMVKHAKEVHAKEIPYVFDPGQQITQVTGEEIVEILSKASFVIANDYEWSMIQKKAKMNEEEIRALPELRAAIITLGAKGSRILPKDEKEILVKSGTTDKFIDPTGAGDAFRAGFFASYVKGAPLKVCAQTGSIAGLFAIEYHGTQNPEFSLESFRTRYKEVYKEKAPL